MEVCQRQFKMHFLKLFLQPLAPNANKLRFGSRTTSVGLDIEGPQVIQKHLCLSFLPPCSVTSAEDFLLLLTTVRCFCSLQMFQPGCLWVSLQAFQSRRVCMETMQVNCLTQVGHKLESMCRCEKQKKIHLKSPVWKREGI